MRSGSGVVLPEVSSTRSRLPGVPASTGRRRWSPGRSRSHARDGQAARARGRARSEQQPCPEATAGPGYRPSTAPVVRRTRLPRPLDPKHHNRVAQPASDCSSLRERCPAGPRDGVRSHPGTPSSAEPRHRHGRGPAQPSGATELGPFGMRVPRGSTADSVVTMADARPLEAGHHGRHVHARAARRRARLQRGACSAEPASSKRCARCAPSRPRERRCAHRVPTPGRRRSFGRGPASVPAGQRVH